MTASIAAGFWPVFGGRTLPQPVPTVVVMSEFSPTPSSIVTEQEQAEDWRTFLLHRLVQEIRSNPALDALSVRRFVHWLGYLPMSLPEPYFGIGDDGAIAVEWDRFGNHLHVSFDRDGDEVYFFSRSGDEWESDIEPGMEKMADAFRVIAGAL